MRSIFLFCFILGSCPGSFACSCFGPQTFCGTLNPQPPEFPEPEWWVPETIILGVKVAQEAHGMDVRVLETISGTPQPEDVLRIWGDCGLLCRYYPDTWEIGDTVVWALKFTDLMGNGLCGTSLEQEGDYMISICGTYFLNYNDGMVTGPIADGVDELPYPSLAQFISTCLAMEVPEQELPDPEVGVIRDELIVDLSNSAFKSGTKVHVIDASGRTLIEVQTTGPRTAIPIGSLKAGVHLVRLEDGIRSRTVRVVWP